jgi:hypothetical protein
MKKPNQLIAHEIFENNLEDFKQNKDYALLNKPNQIVVSRIVNNLIREEYY